MKKKLHLYKCISCDFDFGVAEDYEQQVDVKCPVCFGKDIVDYQQTVLYRIFEKNPDEVTYKNIFIAFQKILVVYCLVLKLK